MASVPFHLDWVFGTTSLITLYFIGKKKWWAWILSFVTAIGYIYINAHFGLYGLIPVNVIALWITAKNAWDWYHDDRKRDC